MIEDGKFVPKWKYEEKCNENLALCKKPEVKVIIDCLTHNRDLNYKEKR